VADSADVAALDVAPPHSSRILKVLPALLTLAVFVNAALLFSVQPMFAKLVLPFLGGVPSVWNTCLVFFQAALLAGYLYAHVSTRILGRRRQAIIHVAILACSVALLPLQLRVRGSPPVGAQGIVWLLALLSTSIGIPFVMLASGALMAQTWLADSGHPDATDPYFLYAASNLGSMVALLSYPLLLEPALTLSEQRLAWSAVYAILVLLVAACAWMVIQRQSTMAMASASVPIASVQLSILDRARWVIYAAVPSSLLIGVTTHISTDVAAVPLLWIVPLALYLLSFVLVFSRRPLVPHSWMVKAEAYALVIAAIPLFWNLRLPGLPGIALNLFVLFVVAMVCHGELVRWRPPPSQLTEFYVWIAVGGLIGGVFTALIAPIVFSTVAEYPIALAVAGLLRPAHNSGQKPRFADFLLPLLIGTCLILLPSNIGRPPSPLPIVMTIVLGVAVFSCRERPLRFGLVLAAVFAAGEFRGYVGHGTFDVLYRRRSFFGVSRVVWPARGGVVVLEHGTTIHGAQSLSPSHRLEPLTYYHREGPAGDIFTGTSPAVRPLRSVAVIGLGTGSLACYGRRGERWVYYEIDPVVAEIARNPRFFTFLRDCPPDVRILLGDGRLTLRRSGATGYDILVLDAFSSDAIPVHLLTREAIGEYLRALSPGGVIAVHISNEAIDLEPVIAATARDVGLVARVRRDLLIPAAKYGPTGRAKSIWVVLSRMPCDLGELATDPRWESLRFRSGVDAWTDDYSNIFRVFRWKALH